MGKEIKDCRLNIRVTPSFKTRLEKAAKLDSRTLANFVSLVLEKELERKGD